MQDDWVEWIDEAEFAYNNRVHSATGYSPFTLEFHRHPNLPQTISLPMRKVPEAHEFYAKMELAQANAQLALKKAGENMEEYFNRKVQDAPRYEIGDEVWLDTRNLDMKRPMRKLGNKREGPYKILKVYPPLNYELELPPTWQVFPVFHTNLLMPAKINRELHPEDEETDESLRPPPDVIDGVKEWEVEAILAHKRVKRTLHFLVKWKNYTSKENSWEPRPNLRGAQDILWTYKFQKGLRKELNHKKRKRR
jgi:Chromo (CHRromatin Organisation MOdifier) domain